MKALKLHNPMIQFLANISWLEYQAFPRKGEWGRARAGGRLSFYFSLPVPTPLKKPPSRAINQSVEDFLDDLFRILNFNSCAVLAMTILRFSVLCPLVLFMHSENLDFFYRGKEHRRFLSTVWLQQVSCTLSTVSPLKRQYARPQHCTCVLLWSSALPFAMDLEKSSRVVQLLPLHIVLIFFVNFRLNLS